MCHLSLILSTRGRCACSWIHKLMWLLYAYTHMAMHTVATHTHALTICSIIYSRYRISCDDAVTVFT